MLRDKIYSVYGVQIKSSCRGILSDEATPSIGINFCSRIRTFAVINVISGIFILALMRIWWTNGCTKLETLHARNVYGDTIWRNTMRWRHLIVVLVDRGGVAIVSYTKTFWSIEYTRRR